MKIAIIGYGKMGKVIEELAIKRGHTITLKASSLIPFTADELKSSDVAIEFTRPESAVKNIFKCFDANVPCVVGTTGWYNRFEEVESRCLNGNHALFTASNFSLGVNIFFEVNRKLASLMNRFDEYKASVREIHHTEKLDKPSGTAISLAEDMIHEMQYLESWTDHETALDTELKVISERLPNVPGTHEVTYESEVDCLRFTHTAKNRYGFALGAIMAAEWIENKTGVFSMRHLLKLQP